MSNVFVVTNDKGGAGKSILAKYVMPVLLSDQFESINVYEIDNSNVVRDCNDYFKSDHVAYRPFKIDEQNEAIFDVSFNEDDDSIVSIIDSGGGDDVAAVLGALSKNKIADPVFIIPTNDDAEQFENVSNTIKKIHQHYKKPRIVLVLNKVQDLSSPKEQFVNLFGKDEWGFQPKYPQLEKHIDTMCMIPDTRLFVALKNQHRTALLDIYIMAKDLVENANQYRQQWREEAKAKGDKQFYFSKLETLNFADDIVEFVAILKKSFKDL